MKVFILENTLRRVALLYIFVNLFHGWLNRRQLDSHLYFSAPILLPYTLAEVNGENLALRSYAVGERRSFFFY